MWAPITDFFTPAQILAPHLSGVTIERGIIIGRGATQNMNLGSGIQTIACNTVSSDPRFKRAKYNVLYWREYKDNRSLANQATMGFYEDDSALPTFRTNKDASPMGAFQAGTYSGYSPGFMERPKNNINWFGFLFGLGYYTDGTGLPTDFAIEAYWDYEPEIEEVEEPEVKKRNPVSIPACDIIDNWSNCK